MLYGHQKSACDQNEREFHRSHWRIKRGGVRYCEGHIAIIMHSIPFERPVIVCIAICGGIRGRRNDWVSHQGVPFWCLRLDDTVCVENQVIEYQLTVFIRCLRFQIFPFAGV